MDMSFVHLRVHSEYSIIDGIVRIEAYIARALALGLPAIALTDHMNLFALVKFYQAAISAGLKPIIGADILLYADNTVSHCTLLCKNHTGYRNLTRLLSQAYIKGYRDHQPVIDWEWLIAASEGLIVLSGGKAGNVGRALLQNDINLANQHIKKWMTYFSGNYYLEIQRTQRYDEENLIALTVDLSVHHQIPVVATNDVRFLDQDDFEAHEARVCIHRGWILDDKKRARDYSAEQYLKSQEAMGALFSDIPSAIINARQISLRCNVTLTLSTIFLPEFPTPDHYTAPEYLKRESLHGLAQRLKQQLKEQKIPERYYLRLESELDVIIRMGFSGYFLIVADFINWAKKNDIPVGPGRGSGAGSLVAYVLGITELDPLQHNLLFERFLNPERISMPDFDIDFCMEGRDRVIEYVAERYGHEAVAQIITYGTMAAKAVVRDVGRVLGLPYGFVDKIAKLVPFELGITLRKALDQEETLRQRYEKEEEVRGLIDLAMRLEGITRNAGKHAGGLVIAPTKLTDFLPLYCEEHSQQAVTQFDKDDVETIGLVKFDFLGLRTLTIIHWALQMIHRKREEAGLPIININEIPLDDSDTFALLKHYSTTAIFQLESRGMKDLVRRVQPDCFEEITALVALFRPGPLQSGMVDDFIDRKHGKARVSYLHPLLETILQPTYGVILYQEQVMEIAQVLAGYTLGSADILRRAMGKKKPEEMAKQRAIFVDGAAQRGVSAEIAAAIFDLIEKFAGYGFNKSHSAAYALIAYQTAWLKAHYPAEFMAAVLSSDMDNTDKIVSFIDECKTMQLIVHPPDINKSDYAFTVHHEHGTPDHHIDQIIYGLGAIKGVGQALIQEIVAARARDGAYQNLFDFCHRVYSRKLTRRALEPLIKSGACDSLGQPREVLFANIDKAFQYVQQKSRNIARGQADLFSETENEEVSYNPPKTAWTDAERLEGEKTTLGLYLSGHPLDSYQYDLNAMTKNKIAALVAPELRSGPVIIAGLLLNLRTILTRTGKRMGIMTLEDLTGRIEVTLFTEVYQNTVAQLILGEIFLVKGTVTKDEYSGGIKILAEAVLPFEEARHRMARALVIHVIDQQNGESLVNQLPLLIQEFGTGRTPIKVIYQNRTTLQLGDTFRIRPSAPFLSRLYEHYGRACVTLEYHGISDKNLG